MIANSYHGATSPKATSRVNRLAIEKLGYQPPRFEGFPGAVNNGSVAPEFSQIPVLTG